MNINSSTVSNAQLIKPPPMHRLHIQRHVSPVYAHWERYAEQHPDAIVLIAFLSDMETYGDHAIFMQAEFSRTQFVNPTIRRVPVKVAKVYGNRAQVIKDLITLHGKEVFVLDYKGMVLAHHPKPTPIPPQPACLPATHRAYEHLRLARQRWHMPPYDVGDDAHGIGLTVRQRWIGQGLKLEVHLGQADSPALMLDIEKHPNLRSLFNLDARTWNEPVVRAFLVWFAEEILRKPAQLKHWTPLKAEPVVLLPSPVDVITVRKPEVLLLPAWCASTIPSNPLLNKTVTVPGVFHRATVTGYDPRGWYRIQGDYGVIHRQATDFSVV